MNSLSKEKMGESVLGESPCILNIRGTVVIVVKYTSFERRYIYECIYPIHIYARNVYNRTVNAYNTLLHGRKAPERSSISYYYYNERDARGHTQNAAMTSYAIIKMSRNDLFGSARTTATPGSAGRPATATMDIGPPP